MKKIVLVTGSAGFIGGYVVEELLKKNFKVIGVDDYSNIKIKRSYENMKILTFKLDVRNEKLYKIMKNCDYVIAGAALIGGISYFHTFAYDLLSKNEQIIASTCNAAIKAHKYGRLKILYLSSSMVFESTNKWPSKEGSELRIPVPSSSYGFQKLSLEFFAKSAYQQYKLPYTIIRPFNCVGIGEVSKAKSDKSIKSGNIELAMSHVVPDLIQKILKGQYPLRILGTGKQIRHYTYGGDLAQGIVLALTHPKALNEDFNLSNDQGTNVVNLAKIIWKKIHGNKKKFKYVLEKPFLYDVQKRVPSTLKAKKI